MEVIEPKTCSASTYYDMGCRLTRTESTELCEQTTKDAENQGDVPNGQTKVPRKDTPAHGHEYLRNGYSPNSSLATPKPIGEVESASQADFFRMLDAKIAHELRITSQNLTWKKHCWNGALTEQHIPRSYEPILLRFTLVRKWFELVRDMVQKTALNTRAG